MVREPVDDAAAEVDRAGFLEVARRHRDLADAHVAGDRLRHELLVETKSSHVERYGIASSSRGCRREAGVVLRQMRPKARFFHDVRNGC